MENTKKSVNQLVNYFRPEGYMLEVSAKPGSREFEGQVFIQGNKTGEFVRLHAKGLSFNEVRVNTQNAEVIALENDEIELRPVKDSKLSEDYRVDVKEHWGVDCDTSIAIDFSGKISDNSMHGLYPCYYQFEGRQHELLATQLESHHARELFPCVDEPAAKAKFTCQVNTSAEFQVLGNMPSESDTVFDDEVDGKVVSNRRVVFQMTPRMSTYLLAFVIGDLHKKSAETKSGVEVNIYATPAQPAESLDFALETATKCIDFYDEYFGIKYPLPKSDHVALPDFSSGAMENWGLVTYRETALLADKNTGVVSRQYIATVIAHELSHQWFGNLVTMKWWNDLWLNESFASLMEHIATDAIFPDWNMWQTFDISEVISALKRDCISGVQPVRQDINHPDEISTLFDPSIVYAKGERLLKMLRAFIGEDDFRHGLREYFSKHAYGNTSADDLWQCLSVASGKDVASLMNPWLTRPGYPVVHARMEGNTITLSQQRFLIDGTIDDMIWPIPLFINDNSAPKLMDGKEISFEVGDIDNLQLNVGNNAHFISVYDDNLGDKILSNMSSFSATDRAKLLNEVLIMAQPGFVSTDKILDLLPTYTEEDNDGVWDIIAMAIGVIARFVEPGSDDEKRLRKISGKLAEEQYNRLGWDIREPETMNDSRLRPTIISEMLFAENPAAVTKSLSVYSDFKHKLSQMNGDLRSTTLGSVVKNAEYEEFEYLLSQYKTSSSADLKQDIAAALTSTKNQKQIDELLEMVGDLKVVKAQDLFYWYIWMLRNRYSRTKTWDWMVNNWSWIERTFGGDKSYDMFPRYAGQILQTDDDLEKYREFFTPKLSEPALKRAIEIGINEISARAKWIARDKAAVIEKLADIADIH